MQRRKHNRTRLSVERLERRELLAYDFGYALGVGSAGIDNGLGLAADSAGNVSVVGAYGAVASASIDLDPGPGSYMLPNDGGTEGFAAQYDPLGNLRWGVHFGSPGSNSAAEVAVDGTGNTLVAGTFTGSVRIGKPGATPITLTATGDIEGLLAKIDPAGNVLWARTLGENGVRRRAFDIAVDSSGNIYATGVPEGTKQTYVAKYDGASGATEWSKLVSGGTGINYSGYVTHASGSELAVDLAGNVHVTGTFMGTIDFNPDQAVTNNLSNAGTTTGKKKVVNTQSDVFVLKLNSGGNYVWAGGLGGGGEDLAGRIAVDGAGNSYVSGSFGSVGTRAAIDADPGLGKLNLPAGPFVVKLAPHQNLIWGRSDTAAMSEVDSAGNIYTASSFTGSIDADPGAGVFNLTSAGSNDVLVRKLDSAGNFVWAASMGGTASDIGRDLAVDGQGNLYTTGMFKGPADFDQGSGIYTLSSVLDANGVATSDAFVSKLVPSAALHAASSPSSPRPAKPLEVAQVRTLLTAAIAYWQASGTDVSGLLDIDIRIANLGGTTLGLASGRTIVLDDNAAGGGWFIDATPWGSSEFTRRGNQGEQNRMDLFSVLVHEVGHLLGNDHGDDGVMQETLSAGNRLTAQVHAVDEFWALVGLEEFAKNRVPTRFYGSRNMRPAGSSAV